MPPKCFQNLDNGQRCASPAIHGSKYCRHHHDQQRAARPANEKLSENEPLKLPPLVDKPSLLVAINEVAHALAEGRIKHSVADTLLSAFKFAGRLITEIGAAEGGMSIPVSMDELFLPPQSSNGVSLAASGARKTDELRPTLPAFSYQTDVDPATARIIKDILAQSHEMIDNQDHKAR